MKFKKISALLLGLIMVFTFAANAMADGWAMHKEELWLDNEGQPIYGEIYIPDVVQEKYPTIIMCHGLGNTCSNLATYAKSFATDGYVTYIFDFIGGGEKSRSGAADGDMTGMSVLTEYDDLCHVIDQLKELDYVDGDNIFLVGASQGGYIAAYTATQRPDDIQGSTLFFPAFVIGENLREQFPSIDDIPETYEGAFNRVFGAKYAIDALGIDIYDELTKYPNDVLILHGDKDDMVELKYSEKALDYFPSAVLKVYEGSGHGFAAEALLESINDVEEYVAAHIK